MKKMKVLRWSSMLLFDGQSSESVRKPVHVASECSLKLHIKLHRPAAHWQLPVWPQCGWNHTLTSHFNDLWQKWAASCDHVLFEHFSFTLKHKQTLCCHQWSSVRLSRRRHTFKCFQSTKWSFFNFKKCFRRNSDVYCVCRLLCQWLL